MNAERLLKLAEHLESGKLGHEKFDFGAWNATRDDDNPPPHTCGFAGCAIGECPILWPSGWEFDKSATPVLKGAEPDDHAGWSPLFAARKWFSIELDDVRALFVPHNQYRGGRIKLRALDDTATPAEVAANIRAFVAHHQQPVSA